MHCFALYLGFSLFPDALADKRIRTAPTKNASQQEAPGVVPGDGSLWDFIDGPSDAADAAALGASPTDVDDTTTQSERSAIGTLSELMQWSHIGPSMSVPVSTFILRRWKCLSLTRSALPISIRTISTFR